MDAANLAPVDLEKVAGFADNLDCKRVFLNLSRHNLRLLFEAENRECVECDIDLLYGEGEVPKFLAGCERIR
jgi:hypothetical protein